MLRRFALPRSRSLAQSLEKIVCIQQVRHFNSLNEEDPIDGIRFEKIRRIIKFNADVLVSGDQRKIDAFASTFDKNDKKRFGIIFDTNGNKIGVMCNRLIDVEKKLSLIREAGEKEFHTGKRDQAIEKMMTEMIKNLDWSDVKFWQYIKYYHSYSLMLATVAGLMIAYCYLMRSKQTHSFEGELWKYGGTTTINSAKNNEVPKQSIIVPASVEQTTPAIDRSVSDIIQFREAVARMNLPKETKPSWIESIIYFIKRHYGKMILVAASLLFFFWPKFVGGAGASTNTRFTKKNPVDSISSSDSASPCTQPQFKSGIDLMSNIPYATVVDSLPRKENPPVPVPAQPAQSVAQRLDLDDIMRS